MKRRQIIIIGIVLVQILLMGAALPQVDQESLMQASIGHRDAWLLTLRETLEVSGPGWLAARCESQRCLRARHHGLLWHPGSIRSWMNASERHEAGREQRGDGDGGDAGDAIHGVGGTSRPRHRGFTYRLRDRSRRRRVARAGYDPRRLARALTGV